MLLKLCSGIVLSICVMIVPLPGYIEPGMQKHTIVFTVLCLLLFMRYSRKPGAMFILQAWRKIVVVGKQKEILVLLAYLFLFALSCFLLCGNLALDL